MTETVTYSFNDGIATIRIDDGKRNALAPAVLDEIYAAFDRAEADQAVVILTGREDVLSAGFDLKVMKSGKGALGMLSKGYGLPVRILRYPYPVIVASPGHVLAMGVFMMLSADYIIGSRGDYKIAANEVAIGMTMPRIASAVMQQRVNPGAFQRAITLADYFDPESALAAGFFDLLVEPDELEAKAQTLAAAAKNLDMQAHKATKRRIRKTLVRKIRWGRWLDLFDAALIGLRRQKKR